MKNLLNRMSLEEIELIPESRFKGKFKGRKVVVSGWYDGYKWGNKSRDRMYHKVKCILRRSVGQKWDDIYSKLCHMTKNVPYKHDLDWWVSDIIKPYWNVKEKRWYGVRYRSYHFDLFYKVKSLRSTTVYSGSFDEMYWVCPNTGKLRYVRTKRKPAPSKEEVRRNYEKRAQRRRDSRLERGEKKVRGIPQLAMINRSDLYGFYNQLIFKYKSLEQELWKDRLDTPPKFEKTERYYSMKLKKMVTKPIPDARAKYLKKLELWKAMNGWKQHRMEEIRIEMAKLKPQIEALERGEFNIFFESNVYLYSIQKECHHF